MIMDGSDPTRAMPSPGPVVWTAATRQGNVRASLRDREINTIPGGVASVVVQR
jgi:hypothetical protein